MVQGNVDGSAGPRSMGYARSVTVNHMSETVMLMARARTGIDPMPDFVLWPENSSDMDPTDDSDTAYVINAAAQLAGMPIMVGAVMDGPGDDQRQTSALWWVPDQGIEARYDKRNAVPFGEFTPMRSLMFKLFPQTEEVGKQTVPGTKPGVLHVTLPDGRELAIGDTICYELAFDSTVYDLVRDGGQIITVQSNNASYTGTFQPRQQFQITRVRAMETQREIVVATTSSFSGLIDAKGRVVDQTQESTAWAQTYQVPQRSGVSWGVRVGPWFECVAAGVGCLAMIAGIVVGARRRGNHGH
jgi:apolipoprotein N-acyltransferase